MMNPGNTVTFNGSDIECNSRPGTITSQLRQAESIQKSNLTTYSCSYQTGPLFSAKWSYEQVIFREHRYYETYYSFPGVAHLQVVEEVLSYRGVCS